MVLEMKSGPRTIRMPFASGVELDSGGELWKITIRGHDGERFTRVRSDHWTLSYDCESRVVTLTEKR